MSEKQAQPMSWGIILVIMIATGLVTGVLMGLLRDLVGYTGGTAGVGASIGVVGGLLIARRRTLLQKQKDSASHE